MNSRKRILFTLFSLSFFLIGKAQEDANFKSPFKSGRYLRLGLNSIGHGINNTSSVEDNFLHSNFGASTGFSFDKGRIYYFLKKKPHQLVNVGLDWTQFAVSFNSSKKNWQNYANSIGETAEFKAPLAVSIMSKLGPFVSFNPVEKLIIDLRGQVAFGYSTTLLQYEGDYQIFNAATHQSTDEETNVLADFFKSNLAVKPNFGITIRRSFIGLSFDVSSSKQNFKYNLDEDESGTPINKTAKIPFDYKQIKLSFHF